MINEIDGIANLPWGGKPSRAFKPYRQDMQAIARLAYASLPIIGLILAVIP